MSKTELARGLILLGALALVTACLGAGPAAVVKDFQRLIEDGQIEDAMELISKDSLSTLGEEKVRTVLRLGNRQIKEKGGIEKLRIEKEEITGELATVSTYTEYGNGESDFSDVELTKEDGDWKILLGAEK